MYSKKQWDELVKEFEAKEARLLHSKNREYTGGRGKESFLLNFEEVAVFEGREPAQVALTWLLKHVHGICKAVGTGEYNWEWENDNGEQLKQRISDARNYLLLLAGCLDELERHGS